MTDEKCLQFLLAWLAFGCAVSVYVMVSAGFPRHHRAWAALFYYLVAMCGPLVLLLYFVPTEVIHRASQGMRRWLDA